MEFVALYLSLILKKGRSNIANCTISVFQSLGVVTGIRKLVLGAGCWVVFAFTASGQCLFTATASSTPILCNGETSTITIVASTGGVIPYTYSFNGVIQVGNGVFSGIPAGINYSWSVTDANNCSPAVSGNITISQPDLLLPGTINTNLSQFCLGGRGVIGGDIPDYIQASGGSGNLIYTWQIDIGCTNSFTDIPGANSPSYTPDPPTSLGSTCYRRKVTDGNGCEAFTGVKTFEVFPDLVSQSIIPSPSNLAVCAGTQVSATFTGGSGGFMGGYTDIYEYSTNSGVNWISYVSGQQISTVGLSGTDVLRIRTRREAYGVDGCNWGDYVIVSWKVNPLPVATISSSGPTTFCQGGSVILTSSTSSSYLWNTGATTQSITVGTSGSYSITVTDANGCSSTSSATSVIVNPLPTPTITPGGPTTFCEGGSVILTSSAASSYLWNTGATTQSITVSASGSYSVTVTDPNGCSATSAATSVTVNQLPTPAITPGGPTTFCQGGSVILTSSASSSYLWNTGATTQSITVGTSGSYSVTVTDANGCSATSAATSVTVNPLPTTTITPGGPTTFCQGGSVILTSSVASSYLWNTGATTQSITISASGSYSVTVTDANGCSATSAATSVTVNPLPTPAITPGGPTTFCQGGSVILTSSAGSSYLWNTGATTQSITVSTSGAYSVTVTDGNTCSATSAATSVTVNPLPTPTITPGGPTTFCQGGSVVLTSSVASSYMWNTGATTQSITVSTSGAYSVTVTDGNTCSAISAATSVTINALPTASINYAGNPFCTSLVSATPTVTVLTGGPFTATSFSSTAGLSINTSTGVITPGSSTPGTYTVTYSFTGANGCVAYPVTTSVTITNAPAATINYSGSPFCRSVSTAQSVTRTGTAGGTYSASPAGLSISSATGAITPSSSTAGTYTVTYTIAASGGCALFTTTTSVIITSVPTATISYAGTPFCTSILTVRPVTLAGTGAYSGGTFSSTSGLSIDPSTGGITPSSSTAGTYTITYTIPASGGCAAVPVTTSVTISTAPAATINYAGSPFCRSVSTAQSVTRTGTPGGTYSASPAGLTMNSATGAITPSSSTAGTYTVTYTIAASGGCALFTTTTAVIITSVPTATISYAGTPFCTSIVTTRPVTLTGTGAYTGGTFSSTSGLSIDPSTGGITPSSSTAGTYTITYTIPASGGCAAVPVTTSVTISTAPAATINYAGSPFCRSVSTAQSVTRTGTAGGTYSASPAGLSISSATGAITPSSSTAGTYTVTYTIAASGGCALFTTTTSVIITSVPTATISYAGTPFCTSIVTTRPVTLTGTGAYTGGTFSSTSGLSIDPSTGGITPSSSTAGTYTITYTIPASGGCAAVPVTTSVTISTAPAVTINYAGSPFCRSVSTAQSVTRTGTPRRYIFSITCRFNNELCHWCYNAKLQYCRNLYSDIYYCSIRWLCNFFYKYISNYFCRPNDC